MKKTEKRILVFGGSFDPPQNGHALVLREVLKRVPCEKAIIIPSADRLDKLIGTSGTDRFEMVHRMCSECIPEFLYKVEISLIELTRGKPSTTCETERELKGRYPGSEIAFIVGSDVLPEVRTKWIEGEYLWGYANFIAYPRKGFSLGTSQCIPRNTDILEIPEALTMEISSTDVRERIGKGESIDDLVPASVAAYIRENGLYR